MIAILMMSAKLAALGFLKIVLESYCTCGHAIKVTQHLNKKRDENES